MINPTDTFVYRRVHPVTNAVSNGRASIQQLTDLVGASIETPDPQSSLPVGGTTGQVLTKNSPTDFDVSWTTVSGGGGGGATNLTYTASTRTLNSSTGTGTTLPLFTVSDAGLTPASGGGTANFLRADGTWAPPPSGGGGGVTSVGGTGTVSGLTLTGTVTSTGNLTLGGTLAVVPSNFASQTANTFLAAPNGSAGTPTFRAIVAADIPTLNQNTTGSAATLTTSRAITMTGDVSWTVNFNGSTAVSAAGTIQNGVVTYAKIQDVAANSVLARAAATSGAVGAVALSNSQLFGRGATGDLAPITLGTNLSMSGTTLNATGGGGGGLTNNWTATSAPTASNDNTQGYAVGSQWFWPARGQLWTCASAATGAAVWIISNMPRVPVLNSNAYFRTDFYEPADDQGTDYPGAYWRRFANSAGTTRPQGEKHVGRVFRKGTTATGNSGLGITGARVGSIPVHPDVTSTTGTILQIRPTVLAGFTDAPDATNDYTVQFGFHSNGSNNAPTTATDYAVFAYRWSGTAVEFVATTRGGGSVTTTALTTPAPATDVALQVIINGTSSVVFLVDGVVVATHTTNIPRQFPASSANYGNALGIWGVAGTVDRGFWAKMLDLLIRVV